MRNACLIFGFCALSACQTTTGANPVVQSAPSGSAPIERVSNVEVGNTPVEAAFAAQYFVQTCGISGQGRDALERVLSRGNVVQSSDTGTYFHQDLDLSIKLQNASCSMVFVSTERPAAVAARFSGMSSAQGPVRFRDDGVIGGEHYYSVRL